MAVSFVIIWLQTLTDSSLHFHDGVLVVVDGRQADWTTTYWIIKLWLFFRAADGGGGGGGRVVAGGGTHYIHHHSLQSASRAGHAIHWCRDLFSLFFG